MPIDRGDPHRQLLIDVFSAAIAAVHGQRCVAEHLRADPIDGPVRLVALGKAAQAMAEGATAQLGADVLGGFVVSKAGHIDQHWLTQRGFTGIVGGHPVPTEASLRAGESLLTAVAQRADATWLFLISGGASSLVESPIGGLGLAELQQANRWLLGSGLPIGSVNLVRKALSRIKGGGLLRWVAADRLRILAISDVPGDDPAVIGSGLLVPDPRLAEQLAQLALPDWLQTWVAAGLADRARLPEASPPVEVVANLERALRAAAEAARARGWSVHLHPEPVFGEAEARGADLAAEIAGGPAGVHVWGGETTVRLPPRPGRGGRNQQLALAAALAMTGRERCWLLSAGTDGTDGPTDAAGALVDVGTVQRAADAGFAVEESLQAADAGRLLAATGELLHTGPTGTNVMDLILGLKA